jgi:hypothetical protein
VVQAHDLARSRFDAHRAQDVYLSFRFDAFRDRFHAKSIRDADQHFDNGVRGLIGHPKIDSDEIDDTGGNRLFFDEECFLRGTTGRFQIDTLVPVSGRAVIAGSADDGATLRDVATDIEDVRSRIKYL